ncbi:MAG TPA: biotin/lipoyl-containing protein [Thermoanaerobaculia bacterium]|nr:biotin/lipoyl-containing protein [Thermoanaerobaculia bacterium]
MKFVARHDGVDYQVDVERHGSGYRVCIDDRCMMADMIEAGPYVRSLRLEDGTQISLLHHRDGNVHEISMMNAAVKLELIDPLALRRKSREDESGAGGTIKALMPGRIVRILVNKGDAVRKGTGLLILEAMKMENEIAATADGVVEEIFVTLGQTVEAGGDLIHVT